MSELSELSADARSLVEQGRDADGPSASDRQRIKSRLAAELGAGAFVVAAAATTLPAALPAAGAGAPALVAPSAAAAQPVDTRTGEGGRRGERRGRAVPRRGHAAAAHAAPRSAHGRDGCAGNRQRRAARRPPPGSAASASRTQPNAIAPATSLGEAAETKALLPTPARTLRAPRPAQQRPPPSLRRAKARPHGAFDARRRAGPARGSPTSAARASAAARPRARAATRGRLCERKPRRGATRHRGARALPAGRARPRVGGELSGTCAWLSARRARAQGVRATMRRTPRASAAALRRVRVDVLWLALGVLASGCIDSMSVGISPLATLDASVTAEPDAATPDAPPRDAGSTRLDSAVRGVEAGPVDAAPPDATVRDAAPHDASSRCRLRCRLRCRPGTRRRHRVLRGALVCDRGDRTARSGLPEGRSIGLPARGKRQCSGTACRNNKGSSTKHEHEETSTRTSTLTITLTILVDADDLDPEDDRRGRATRRTCCQRRSAPARLDTRDDPTGRSLTDACATRPIVFGVEVVRVGENREGDREGVVSCSCSCSCSCSIS